MKVSSFLQVVSQHSSWRVRYLTRSPSICSPSNVVQKKHPSRRRSVRKEWRAGYGSCAANTLDQQRHIWDISESHSWYNWWRNKGEVIQHETINLCPQEQIQVLCPLFVIFYLARNLAQFQRVDIRLTTVGKIGPIFS